MRQYKVDDLLTATHPFLSQEKFEQAMRQVLDDNANFWFRKGREVVIDRVNACLESCKLPDAPPSVGE